jgi:transcriptional regulator with XRE-family HTH domain
VFGGEIRRRREELGLTGAQLAAKADMAPSAVSQIETGKRTPSSTSVIKLAAALGVDVGALYPEAQAPLPLEYTPSLEELHANAGLGTDWLVKPEEEWRAAWDQISSPREAVLAVFDLGDEYSAVRKRIAELDPALARPHRLISGPYKQAFVRWIYGMQNAHSCGVAAGRIAIADTLNDLVKEVGLEDEMRKREQMRKKRGAEPLEGMQLAS